MSDSIDMEIPKLPTLFAHHFMRDAFLGVPGVIFPLASVKSSEVLGNLWNGFVQGLAKSDASKPEELRCLDPVEFGSHIILPISFPPPGDVTDPYYIALVYKVGPKKGIFRRRAIETRFLTLEYGMAEGGDGRTVLGEWRRDKRKNAEHLNFGDGPPPDLENFLKAVTNLLT